MNNHRILRQALNGQPLKDVFVFDCHGHLGRWIPISGMAGDAESLVARMDRIGIDRLCINKWNAPDMVQANTDVGMALRKYPDRFTGFAATQPCLGKAATVDELKRCFDELGHIGIKIHNAYETLPLRGMWGLPEFNATMEAIWEFAAARKCALLCHWKVPMEVIRRYPEATFILAHALSVREYAHFYALCPNAYFDTAASSTLRGNLDYFIQRVGEDRILYGSDMPMANPAYRLGQVVGTRVPDGTMRKILGENLARMLGITIPAKYRGPNPEGRTS